MIAVDLKSESDDLSDVVLSDYTSSEEEENGYRYDADLWRTRLCPERSNCRNLECNHAHCLLEVRPPNELHVIHPEAWAAGISRFYGQGMTDELVDVFYLYYRSTAEYLCPVWAHALNAYIQNCDLLADAHFPWDYGLTMDMEYLRRGRVGGQRPFDYVPGLWLQLQSRKRELALEQDDS